MRIVVLVTLLSSLSVAAGPGAYARSGGSSRVAGWVKEAERLYLAGKYREAAQLLLKADAVEPDSRFVYNIARAFDQAGELGLALTYYQRYVQSPQGTDPVLLKRSSLAVERLLGVLNREATLKNQQDLERERLRKEATASAEAARRAEALNEEHERVEAQARARLNDRTRTVSYGLGGVALLGVGAGVFLGIKAGQAKVQFGLAPTVELKQGWQNTTQVRAALADVSFGVALAAAATAVILYPKGSATQLLAGPLLLPGGGGAFGQVAF